MDPCRGLSSGRPAPLTTGRAHLVRALTMSNKTRFRTWLAAGFLVGATLSAMAGCSAGGAPQGENLGDGKGGTGNGGSSTGGTGGTIPVTGGTGGTIGVDGGPDGTAGGGCGSVSCTPLGGTYCGQIGDECGGSLDCGVCMQTGWTCEEHICVGGPDVCTPGACSVMGADYCGVIGDGCGRGM